MAVTAAPGARSQSWRYFLVLVVCLPALGVLLRALDPARIAGLQNFFIIFGSLLIEAVPFILLGAVVSAAIEVFVPARAFEKLALVPRPLQLPAAGLAGFAFPVCECGSVPVARRLAAKGLAPSAAVTFMLAAPILNPVVIASTFVAYRGRDIVWQMVLGRSVLGWSPPWRSGGSCLLRPGSNSCGLARRASIQASTDSSPAGPPSSNTSRTISSSWVATW